MAFVRFDIYTAKVLEKGLSTCIKAGDMRFSSYGTDNKKKNDDDGILGAAAYVKLYDPENSDPVTAARGTVTKIYFAGDKLSADPHAAVETVHDVGDAVATAKGWVETATSSGGKSYLFTLRARIANCI